MSFDWVSEIEFACPYLDNIVKNPKMSLVKEESIVKIEKAKKTSVASIKDLSKHTHFIEKIDKKTNDVQPAKLLITFNEDTYNIYENRFIYTLIDNILRFISLKEKELEGFESKSDKNLEYAGSTIVAGERINIEFKLNSNELPKDNNMEDFEKEIDSIKLRIRKIKDYINSWKRSEMYQSLEKAHVPLVSPPIKKTNMILKNPNFQIAMRLWSFIQMYDINNKASATENLNTTGDNVLKGILDDSFLMSYFVLDSISSSKRTQKEKLSQYAIVMFNQQIQRAISLLMNSGIKLKDEEILAMVASNLDNEKNQRLIGHADVKKKFKDAMSDYLENIQDYF
jgi:hypothetical protein